jgi:4-amino-4-deoxy-L-arabinose transferase-like glycosyltransferase
VPSLIVLGGLVWGIDGYPLLDPDEGRNAEVAREMAARNDYLVPHLNDLPYIDKPFLHFAATAATMEILGPTVFAARLVPLLFTLATLAILAWFGTRLYGPTGGVIAAVATGSMPLTLGFARTAIMDSTMTTFVVAAVAAFYCAIEAEQTPDGRDRTSRWAICAWVMLALGVFTKGPIALGLPLMIAIPYAVWRKQLRIIFDPVGALLFIAILVPWLALVSRTIPDFLQYALVTETLKRFATPALHRTGPWWYFVPILIAGALPWSLIPLTDWRRSVWQADSGRVDARAVFVLTWIVVPVLFFSLSQSKRPQYLVPIIPAIGLLVAGRWSRANETLAGVRGAAIGLFIVGIVVGSAPYLVPNLLNVHPDVLAAVRPTAWGLGLVSVATGAATWIGQHRRHVAIMLFTLPVATIPVCSLRLMRAIGKERSASDAASAIQPVLTPNSEVVAIHTYPLSLPFYLRRSLTLSTRDASELTSNYLPPRIDRYMSEPATTVRPQDWWIEALTTCARPRVFVADAKDHDVRRFLDRELPLLIETPKLAAYGPCLSTNLARSIRVTPS